MAIGTKSKIRKSKCEEYQVPGRQGGGDGESRGKNDRTPDSAFIPNTPRKASRTFLNFFGACRRTMPGKTWFPAIRAGWREGTERRFRGRDSRVPTPQRAELPQPVVCLAPCYPQDPRRTQLQEWKVAWWPARGSGKRAADPSATRRPAAEEVQELAREASERQTSECAR